MWVNAYKPSCQVYFTNLQLASTGVKEINMNTFLEIQIAKHIHLEVLTHF